MPTTVYITDDDGTFCGSSNGLSGATVLRAKLENALKSPECRPADSDPAGHWGPVVHAWQLSLRLTKTNVSQGEPIDATILLRNVSTDTMRCSWPLDDMVGITWHAKEGNKGSGARYPDPRPGSRFSRTIYPHGQREWHVNLADLLPRNVTGSLVIAVRIRADKSGGSGVLEVPSGDVTLSINGAAHKEDKSGAPTNSK